MFLLWFFWASIVKADAYPIGPSDYYAKLDVKTSLRNGDMGKALQYNLLPMARSLATGTVSGDKITWNFEEAVFYAEGEDEETAKFNLDEWAEAYVEAPDCLASQCNDSKVGLFNVFSLDYSTETREIKNAEGEKIYRCALTGISVKEWFSPYGKICSRKEAVDCYNKCQKQIRMVVSKVKAARQSNGKPLTDEQKLKWIHDWLINSVDYADKEDDEIPAIEFGPPFTNYHINSEYGAIVEGRAVCAGYALAFEAIVDELVRQTGANIECESVTGGFHGWNRVRLNGKWYHVDVTWDDTGECDFFHDDIETTFFLVSDTVLVEQEHPGGEDGYFTSNPEKAMDRKYEGRKWPRYQKDLSECTVTLKEPNKVYVYTGKTIIPSIIVKYGSNVIPPDAYRVVRADKNKTGTGKIEIVPSKDCYALSGSAKGPNFKIADGMISGTAKSTKKYSFSGEKSVRPFDETFQPFANTYKYSKKPGAIKTLGKSLTLKRGADYTVKYKNSTRIGWATATITMKGKYGGKVTVTYKIEKGNLSGTAKSTKQYKLVKSKAIKPFDKTFQPFTNTYKYSKQSTSLNKANQSLTLKKGTDYTVSYKNNKKVGWATATITLKGKYTGRVTVKYKITK